MHNKDDGLDANLLASEIDVDHLEEFATGKKSIKIPIYIKIIYGFGDFSSSAATAIISFYFLPFLFEVADVSPFSASAMLLLARIWDGVLDPVVGRLSDQTNTRFGRRRPWLAISAIPLSISYFFLWLVIPGFGQVLDFFYYLFWLIILNTAFTCVSVPHLSLIPEMTDDDKEQTSLTSFRIITLVLASLIGTSVHGFILALVSSKQLAYFISGSIFSVVFIFPPILAAIVCKETAGQGRPVAPQIGFLKGMKEALKNKSFLLLSAAYLGAFMATQFIITNFYLYVQFVLKAESQVVFMIIILQLSVAVACPVWSIVIGYIGKKPAFYIGLGLCITTSVGLTFLVPSLVLLVYPGAVILGIGAAAIFLVPYTLLPEIIDRDELKTECRREGVYYGLFVFLQKVGISIGLAAGGALLGLVGYNGDVTPETAGTGVFITLRLLTGLIPAVFFVLAIVPMFVYPHGKKGYERSQLAFETMEKEDPSDYQPPAFDDKIN